MAGVRWSEDEVRILDQYERTAKSAFVLYQEMRKAGYNRTYKAVTRKIESMGLRKPTRYATGHEISIGYLDIESTGFSANIDVMLSWCIKGRGEKKVAGACITREEIMSPEQDARIVELLVDEMNKYDVIFTYYGTRFDIPFIRTRALYHGTYFPMYRQKSHKDLYYVVKSKLKLHRSSLMAATEFFGIAGKTRIKPEYWQKARWGDKQSLKYVYEHNVADVEILEDLHRKLEDYAPPTVNPL
tara:strand:+ start:371 stop:1099 length:729 start_codon:yes stop_codon:yes gene_type:complete